MDIRIEWDYSYFVDYFIMELDCMYLVRLLDVNF